MTDTELVVPIALDPVVYWRLKSQLLEVIIREREIQEISRLCAQARVDLLAQAGLDGTKTYQLSDNTLSATEFPPLMPMVKE